MPYDFGRWYLSFITALPQIIGGFFLTFYFSPRNMGVPWKSEYSDLKTFEVSPIFIEVVQEFGFIFTMHPRFFAASAAYSVFFGGICLITGCFTRLASLFIFLTMLVTLLFREFDQSWSYIPTFTFLSISMLGLRFGSGRVGMDYAISKWLNWA